MTAMARLVLLYFLLWVGVTVSTAVDLQKRTVGGRTCNDKDRLYHVSVIESDEIICGGSLIADEWILTAAHCWEPEETMYASVNIHPHPLNNETMKIQRHEIYKDNKNNEHDIMLLKLPRKPKHLHKVDLPLPADCKTDLKKGNTIQVAGHGCDADETSRYWDQCSETLKCANMPVVDCSKIKDELKNEYSDTPYENFVCAEDKTKDTGEGDSGGGAVYKGKIYGVITGGHATHVSAELTEFLRVCKYIGWIQQTISTKP